MCSSWKDDIYQEMEGIQIQVERKEEISKIQWNMFYPDDLSWGDIFSGWEKTSR